MIEQVSPRFPAAIAASIALAFSTLSNAQTFPPFPANGSSEGFGYFGVPVDLPIPTVNPPDYFLLEVKGADGGNAIKNNCSATGGKGALMFAEFPVGRHIEPGGTLRLIVGQKGGTGSATTLAASGGGGGGTGVLYAPPGTSEFIRLAIAGGGGGARASTNPVCLREHGRDGDFSDCTGWSGCGGTGGEADNGGGGGGGWHQRGQSGNGGGGYGGDPVLSPSGSSGGSAGNNGGSGGWGCGGGGGGHRKSGGGGGGFSGGHSSEDAGEGGGGTSFCDPYRVIGSPQYSYYALSGTHGSVWVRAFSSLGESPANPFVVNDELASTPRPSYTSSTQNRRNTIGLEQNTLCGSADENTADEWYRFDNTENVTRRITIRGGPQSEFRVMSVVGSMNAPFSSCNRLGGPNALGAQHDVPANASIWFRVSSVPSIGPTVDYTIEFEVSEAVLAVEAVRLGDPANPNAFLPGQTSGPVVGRTWDPIVDHTTFVPGSTGDVALLGSAELEVPVPGLGTLLVGDIFFSLTATPGQAFALPIPDDPSALGFRLYVQAASLDASSGVHLTNALDLTIGTH